MKKQHKDGLIVIMMSVFTVLILQSYNAHNNQLIQQHTNTQDTINKNIDSVTATLTCNTTSKGVELKWLCPIGATASKGYAPKGVFNTHGANIGNIETANVPGEYKIVCTKIDRVLAEATCEVE